MRQAALNYLVRLQAGDVFAAELYAARLRAQQAGYGLQRGALAGPVRAYQRDYLALVDVEGYALDGVDGAVVYIYIIYPEYCLLYTSQEHGACVAVFAEHQ